MGLQGVELGGLGGDLSVERGEAVGDSLLLGQWYERNREPSERLASKVLYPTTSKETFESGSTSDRL